MTKIDTAAKWIAIAVGVSVLGWMIIRVAAAEPVGTILWIGIIAGIWTYVRRKRGRR